MNKDLLYQIALTRIPLVGAKAARILLRACGGVEAVFKESKKNLLRIQGIGEITAKNISTYKDFDIAEKEMQFISKHNIKALFYTDEVYPQRLRHFEDSPILLYFKGKCELNTERTVAIVGTRKPTENGRQIAAELVRALKGYNVTIISGLASGIDGVAHKTSVENNLPTLGVLGHGLKRIYPTQHRELAKKMLLNGGLITEYLHYAEPLREHFPMRNRIIAGMCDAIIVVESAKSGGSIITANIANNYNKDVFAVPGRLHDKYSIGCNHLIKIHKAALLESAEDIAYIMGWNREGNVASQPQLFIELDDTEQKIANLLKDTDGLSIDKLCYETKLPQSKMASVLINMEFKGLIKNLPGKMYVLIR